MGFDLSLMFCIWVLTLGVCFFFFFLAAVTQISDVLTHPLSVPRLSFLILAFPIFHMCVSFSVLKRSKKSKNDLINAEEGDDHFTDISSVGKRGA